MNDVRIELATYRASNLPLRPLRHRLRWAKRALSLEVNNASIQFFTRLLSIYTYDEHGRT